MTMSRRPLTRSMKKTQTSPLDIKIISNKEEKRKRVYRRKKTLPHDLIVEHILTKVSVPTLVRCGAVSKLWYKTIHKEKYLASLHFLHSKNNAKLGFCLLNVKEDSSNSSVMGNHFFTIDDDKKYLRKWFKVDFDFLTYFLVTTLGNNGRKERMVGYCNGFACVAAMGSPCFKGEYAILNPYRLETLHIFSPDYIFNTNIVSHGFGFDSVRNEYKVVTIYYDDDDDTTRENFKCIVFTLGTKSWRRVATVEPPLSGGHVTYGPANIQIRAVKSSGKAAVFCADDSGDNLFWKIMITSRGGGRHEGPNGNNNVSTNREMLLAFDLRDEKLQFIQLPPLPTASTMEQQKLFVADYHHLLEYKGSLCVTRVEKSLAMTADCYHRRHHYHYQSTSDSRGSCCCCSKVHLHVLKDKAKQLWVKEDTFDVHILEPPCTASVVSDAPCCFCFGSTTTPPTRVFSSSGQVFLYWFYVNHLQLYNLHTKQFKVVSLLTRSSDIRKIFHNKMKEPSGSVDSGGGDDDDEEEEDSDDDDIYCSSMDYQLHAQVQNFLSLQTFLPEGVVSKFDKDAFEKLDLEKEERPYSAYLRIIRHSAEYYPF